MQAEVHLQVGHVEESQRSSGENFKPANGSWKRTKVNKKTLLIKLNTCNEIFISSFECELNVNYVLRKITK